VFWLTVTLAIAYWLVVGIARVVSAWSRGVSKPGAGFGVRVESAGFILASAISGERLATSPALMRFCAFRSCAMCSTPLVNNPHARYTIDARHHIPHTMVCNAGNGRCSMASFRMYVEWILLQVGC